MNADIFDRPEMLRMGWALLHFLWQGTLIALALRGALLLVEQSFSRLRYALALVSLLLMAGLPVLLLCKPQKSLPDAPAAHESVQFEAVSGAGLTTTSVPATGRPDSGDAVVRFITPLVPWTAAFWFLGMALLLLKTVGGVVQVRSMTRRAAVHDASEGTASFHALAARASVSGISVLESGAVSSPTVAGWFRPVVLLPRGALGKIDRPMLDALVAHELAHIRRHDCVMNLFQTVIENLLFFHPAVWWVSKRVRAEREACCDDYAVAVCGDAMVYVRALSQAEQFRSALPVIAIGSSPLLQRIRRLTEMRIAESSPAKLFCISLAALSFIAATAAGSLLLATIPPQNSNSNVPANKASARDMPNQENKQISTPGSRPAFHNGGKGDTVGVKPKDVRQRVVPGAVAGNIIGGSLGPGSRLIYKVDPVYPEAAIQQHVSSRVTLKINVNEEGLVSDTRVVQGHPLLNDAAIKAVKQWKYSPTLFNGKPVPVIATISIMFGFNKDGSPTVTAPAPVPPLSPSSGGKDGLVGGIVGAHYPSYKVDPVYPEAAVRKRVSGKVLIEVKVDEEGVVSDVEVINGHPAFTDAAVTAAKQWKYRPAFWDGKAVPFTENYVIIFGFKKDGSPNVTVAVPPPPRPKK